MAAPKKTATETPKQPHLIPQPNGKGALLSGGMPGNAGGGRKPDIFHERARELCNDPEVWNVVHSFAKAGNLKPLEFAASYTYKKKDVAKFGAQLETPEGYKFTLVLGERDEPDD